MFELMRFRNDCEVSMITTATGKTYEQSKKALGFKDLPGNLENPVFGNPWNLYKALIKLGFWKKNIVLNDLLKEKALPGKTIVLLHNPKDPIFTQHWAVWLGKENGLHKFWWGTKEMPYNFLTDKNLKTGFTAGTPNCAFQVYKASIWRIIYERLRGIFK